ncbi:MAG: SDR family oxidoreductase [Chloroflexi bacterium]|nr:SDR family oxidoreductase [Chloroflexota bacterium]
MPPLTRRSFGKPAQWEDTVTNRRKAIRQFEGRVALVTGASRGVGARVAEVLAARGASVVVNYRSKLRRAEEVAAHARALGVEAIAVAADITSRVETAAMFRRVQERFGKLDILVLNASGGLEKDMPTSYARDLNRDAQEDAVVEALPLIPEGGRVVFVTSHLAHFHGEQPVPEIYEPVAASKRAGEVALRARIPELASRGVSLVVVSGDLIDGTTTPRLMDRKLPGLIDLRREQAGYLPSIDDFAQAIVDAADDPALRSGDTVYVGTTG